MQGHQADHLGVFAVLGVHHESNMVGEAGEILELAERADQFLQVFQPARCLGRLVLLPHPRIAGFLQHDRSEEHTSELQSLMRISYAVFCWKKKNQKYTAHNKTLTYT